MKIFKSITVFAVTQIFQSLWQLAASFIGGLGQENNLLFQISLVVLITFRVSEMALIRLKPDWRYLKFYILVINFIIVALMIEFCIIETAGWKILMFGLEMVIVFWNLQVFIGQKQFYLPSSIILYVIIRLIYDAFSQKNYLLMEPIFVIFLMMIITIFLTIQQGQIMNPSSENKSPEFNLQQNQLINNNPISLDHIQPSPIQETIPFRRNMIHSQRNKTIAIVEKPYTDYVHHGMVSQLSQIEAKSDPINNFYHSLLNLFPSGVLIINQKKKITYMNNKCERLFKCSGKEQLQNQLRSAIMEGKYQNKQTTSKQTNTRWSTQAQLIEVIESIVRGEQIDIFDFLLFPSKYRAASPIQITPRNLDRSVSNQFFPSNSLRSYSQDPNQQHQHGPIINLEFQLQNKLLKISIIQSQLTSSQSDQISVPSQRRIDKPSNLSNDFPTHHPVLLFIIKNHTSKQKLKQVQNDYQFQNGLLQSFSHELRTPLNCSIQMLSLVLDQLPQGSQFLVNIQSALGSNYLLMHQINDILDFASIECNQFEYKWTMMNVQDIAQEIISIYKDACESKQIDFQVKIDPNLNNYTVRNDKGRILQVIINLMNNSIKFTRQSGQIAVKFKLESACIQIGVKDNGVGINQTQLDQIRGILTLKESMTQSLHRSITNKAVGLGINISNRIVSGLGQQNKGLRIKSGVGKGTKISFYIQHQPVKILGNSTSKIFNPMVSEYTVKKKRTAKSKFAQEINQFDSPSDEEIQSDEGSYGSKNLSFQKPIVPLSNSFCFEKMDQQRNGFFNQRSSMVASSLQMTPTLFNLDIKQSSNSMSKTNCSDCIHVLIVDDVPFNIMALKALLAQRNIQCDSAYDGFQAIESVKTKLLQHCKTYKIIFMDIEMPGISGFQTTAEIRKILNANQTDSCVVMCSAYDSQDNLNKAKLYGIIDYVPKPVKKQELTRVLTKFFDQ